MIQESGVIVAIEPDHLWVETVQKTTCGSCASRNGCGQRLLTRLTKRANQIQVLRDKRCTKNFHLGDEVRVGIPENVLVKGALVVYLLPLAGLIFGAWFGDQYYPTELAAILSALLGLSAGALIVKMYSSTKKSDPRYSPVLLDCSE